MFDSSLLNSITTQEKSPYNDVRCQDYLLRSLNINDYSEELFKVLSQLTKADLPTFEDFEKRFNWMKDSGCYYVIICYHKDTNDIVGTATLIVEHKFIHECATRGRVEDVVVDVKGRGKGLGKLLVSACTDLSKKLGCYKTTLECSVDNAPFYEKLGYEKHFEKYMVQRF